MLNQSVAGRVFEFYREGFRNMTLGRSLWKIILIKLAIIFVLLKIFFFPDFLESNFDSDESRADYVLQKLTDQTNASP